MQRRGVFAKSEHFARLPTSRLGWQSTLLAQGHMRQGFVTGRRVLCHAHTLLGMNVPTPSPPANHRGSLPCCQPRPPVPRPIAPLPPSRHEKGHLGRRSEQCNPFECRKLRIGVPGELVSAIFTGETTFVERKFFCRFVIAEMRLTEAHTPPHPHRPLANAFLPPGKCAGIMKLSVSDH
jgi:hypothetical protein